MTEEQEDEVGKLQEIMSSLPDSADFPGHERREYSLTKADVLLIYKIAKVANASHICPFDGDERETLRSWARNVSASQKIASGAIIIALVTGMLSGTWFLIIHFVKAFVATGGK